MILPVYLSARIIENRVYQMRWTEYSFSPLPCESLANGAGPEGWRHYRVSDGVLLLDVPFGSRVVTMMRPAIPPTKTSAGVPGGPEERLAVYWHPYQSPHGMGAETAVSLAVRCERGFKIVDDKVA